MNKIKNRCIMRASSRLFLVIIAALLFSFTSCDDDDGYSLNDFVVRLATVKIDNGVSYILTDSYTTLLPIAGYYPSTNLADGDRIAINYTLLYDDFQGFDHAIKVNNLYKLLSKPIETIETEADDDKYGDDVVWIFDAWVGGDYLNIKFAYPAFAISKPQHRINLVQNKLVEQEQDGYIHLEYRYNAMGDFDKPLEDTYMLLSYVGFNLKSIEIPDDCKGFKVKINSVKNGHRVLTYDFNDTEDKSIDFVENEKASQEEATLKAY